MNCAPTKARITLAREWAAAALSKTREDTGRGSQGRTRWTCTLIKWFFSFVLWEMTARIPCAVFPAPLVLPRQRLRRGGRVPPRHAVSLLLLPPLVVLLSMLPLGQLPAADGLQHSNSVGFFNKNTFCPQPGLLHTVCFELP